MQGVVQSCVACGVRCAMCQSMWRSFRDALEKCGVQYAGSYSDTEDTSGNSIEDELGCYLNDGWYKPSAGEDKSPLHWWRDNEHCFLQLAQCNVLAIPGMSTFSIYIIIHLLHDVQDHFILSQHSNSSLIILQFCSHSQYTTLDTHTIYSPSSYLR